MNKARSDFSIMLVHAEETRGNVEKLHPFLCITDLDAGSISVTNDIENVLRVLVASDNLKPGMRVVYCDTEGMWDEVVIDDQCAFVRFRLMQVPSRDVAITLAITKGKQ